MENEEIKKTSKKSKSEPKELAPKKSQTKTSKKQDEKIFTKSIDGIILQK
jgi:hypothetical protein